MPWWDVAVYALDLRKLRLCRTGNLGGTLDRLDLLLPGKKKKKILAACSLLKGKWSVVQWEHRLHTFDGTDSKGAELFEQRDLFQPNYPPALDSKERDVLERLS